MSGAATCCSSSGAHANDIYSAKRFFVATATGEFTGTNERAPQLLHALYLLLSLHTE